MSRYPSPDQPEPLPLSDEWLARYRTLSAQWATNHQDTDADPTTFALAVAVGPLLDEVDRLRRIVATDPRTYYPESHYGFPELLPDEPTHTHDGVRVDKAIHIEHRP